MVTKLEEFITNEYTALKDKMALWDKQKVGEKDQIAEIAHYLWDRNKEKWYFLQEAVKFIK